MIGRTLLLCVCVFLICATRISSAQEDAEFDDEYAESPKTVAHKATHEIIDDDEFIGSDSAPPKPATQPKIAVKNIETTNRPQEPFALIQKDNWYLEMGFAAVVVVYTIFYLVGRSQNERIVRSWAVAMQSEFMDQFASVGAENSLLIKESQHSFRMPASGRVNCQGLQVNLKLKKRQDIVTFFYNLWYPTEDIMEVTVVMEPTMEPIMFAIVANSEKNSFVKSEKDVEILGKQYNSNLLPAKFTLFSDNIELSNAFLTSDVKKAIEDHAVSIKSIHFTDSWFGHKDFAKVLRFRFRIPTSGQMDRLSLPTKMVFHFIDAVSRVKLSSAEHAKAMKKRTKIAEEVQKEDKELREEALAKKKEEEKKKKKEQISQMSPEAREKLERKLERKELKKRQKMKVMKM